MARFLKAGLGMWVNADRVDEIQEPQRERPISFNGAMPSEPPLWVVGLTYSSGVFQRCSFTSEEDARVFFAKVVGLTVDGFKLLGQRVTEAFEPKL